MRKTHLIVIILAMVLSCKRDPPQNYVTTFPTTPVNMGATINSQYNDYNSASPCRGDNTEMLFFSSNRNSHGGNFDIILKDLSILSCGGGSLSVSGGDDPVIASDYSLCLTSINTNDNQLGPYFLVGSVNNYTTSLLYATDSGGNLNINFVRDAFAAVPNIKAISYLNSTKDDAYPSISKTGSCIYFCSNRQNDFDIYKTFLNTSNSLLQNLSDTTAKTILKDTILSSVGYDDKCPFVIGNTMVFTSNRLGGFGGFDLYYSIYTNGKWGTPVNFGSAINTSADEYRPIVLQINGFNNNFMIFSSNRSGGLGGFDLYYVGITNMINWSTPTE